MNEIALNKSLDVSASCAEGSSYDDCAAKIKDDKADLVTLDGGRVYEAGTRLVCQVLEKFSRVGPS